MDTGFLNTFLIVMEKNSFSKAAKALGISQPAVSFHIKSLERLYGVDLFMRSGGVLTLTEAGQVLSNYSREILKLGVQLDSTIEDLKGRISGTLKIGASSIPGNYILPGLLGDFIELYPDVRPKLLIEDTAKIVDLLQEREIDFGFIGFPAKSKTLKILPFVEDEILFLAHPDLVGKESRELTKNEITALPFILREEGSGTRSSLEKALLKAGIAIKDLKVVLEVGGNEAALNAVESKLGVTAVSGWAAKKAIALKLVNSFAVKGVDLKRKLYFTHLKQSSFLRSGEAFIDFVIMRARA